MIVYVRENGIKTSEISIPNEDILNGGEVLVGREQDCHIVLDSQQVSRYHLSIQYVDNKLMIKNLSEYASVSLNGNNISDAHLKDGDKIKVFDYELELQGLIGFHANDTRSNDSFLNDVPGAEGLTEYNAKANIEQDSSSEEDHTTDVIDTNENNTESEADDFLDEVEPNDEFKPELDDLSSVEKSDDIFDEDSSEEKTEADIEANDFQDQNNFSEEANEFENADFSDEGFGEDNFEDAGFDEGGFDEGGFTEGDDGNATQVISTFANYYLQLLGEYAPFDRYKLEDHETFLGRDPEKCQIVLEDPEVSKVHAVIKKSKINCILEDLNSANGIIYNGERINKAELKNGDEFLVGDTSFTVEITSDILEVESDRLMPVEKDQEVEIEEVVEEEVDFDKFGGDDGEFGSEVEEKSLLKRIWKDKRKRTYFIAGVLILGLLLLGDEDTEPPPSQEKTVKKVKAKKDKKEDKKEYPPEIQEKLEQNYTLALAKSEVGEFYEAKEYIEVVAQIDPNYKDTPLLRKLIQEGYDKIIKIKEEEQAKKERLERQAKIAELLKKAKKAVEERNVAAAKNYFSLIYEIDPENPDVTPLKIDIEAWEEEQKRIKQEKSIKEAKRKSMVDQLAPGKTLYLRGDWYRAIDKLEKFIKTPKMDEDLLKEATEMLQTAKRKLQEIVSPLLSKARSYKEGQDLKQAYEAYGEVLKYEPSNEEALNERAEIFLALSNRSRKIYREALIAESLSLYSKAKEKFQEVQQVSPTNSEYYIKASEKLKNYLE